jgi:hypothetical protein
LIKSDPKSKLDERAWPLFISDRIVSAADI